MTRRTNYKILEGTKEAPKRIVVRVGKHNTRYGRACLPFSVVGKIVEVVVPETPIEDSVLGNGESPIPTKRKPKPTVDESGQVVETTAVKVE